MTESDEVELGEDGTTHATESVDGTDAETMASIQSNKALPKRRFGRFGHGSPMKKIVLPYHESKKGSALTKEEEKTLVDFCIGHKDNEASSALLIMLYFGLRRSELATIRLEENALVCTTSKQRQGRVEVDRRIPFTPVFRRVLPFVDFERAKTVNLSTVHTTFKRLFPERHPHELRYTFITRAKVRVQKGNYEK